MLWYNVGKVAVTLNSKTVTGTGTAWLANVRNGDAFRGPDGQIYLVENVATNTSLSIAPAYGSTSGTGKDYAIVPVQGYQRDLADQVVELIGTYGALGTAAAANLTTSDQDTTSGRVTRVGDWGLGRSTGLVADPVITNNVVNGFYRSGSGSDLGKPVNASGDGYIKFGWSSSYATYLYGSPAVDKLWFKHLNNGVDRGWKELMTVGQYGVGRSGADANLDVFPAANLSELSVGSGAYYYNEAIGSVSGLPFDNVAGYNAGVVFHRQAGTAGGQVVVSSSNRLGWRGRRAGSYHVWREAMYVGEYGFGGAQASPTSWDAQRTGWYYKSGAKPAWGGGGFFLDLAYNTTNFNSGLRISTDPYTDNFYMNGAVSGQKTFRDACKLVHDKNIVGDVAAGSVIATGSNANGTWVRFADGTQICYQTGIDLGWCDLAVGSIFSGSQRIWTYPIAFVSPPSAIPATTAGGADTWVSLGSGAISATQATLNVKSAVIIRSSTTGSMCAIGRWKA